MIEIDKLFKKICSIYKFNFNHTTIILRHEMMKTTNIINLVLACPNSYNLHYILVL